MNDKQVVLIVDDEPEIRKFLRTALLENNFEVLESGTVKEAIDISIERKPQLIILDLGLPDGDGKDVVKSIRNWSNTPIIILSARGEETEKVEALELGADDYLTKPFGINELFARIKVALRRVNIDKPSTETESKITFGDIRIDLARSIVYKSDEEVHLTPIELSLLLCLARASGRVVTQANLLKQVWGPAYARESHYLRIYMAQLRRKLEDNPSYPKYLITEPGVGCRLKIN